MPRCNCMSCVCGGCKTCDGRAAAHPGKTVPAHATRHVLGLTRFALALTGLFLLA